MSTDPPTSPCPACDGQALSLLVLSPQRRVKWPASLQSHCASRGKIVKNIRRLSRRVGPSVEAGRFDSTVPFRGGSYREDTDSGASRRTRTGWRGGWGGRGKMVPVSSCMKGLFRGCRVCGWVMDSPGDFSAQDPNRGHTTTRAIGAMTKSHHPVQDPDPDPDADAGQRGRVTEAIQVKVQSVYRLQKLQPHVVRSAQTGYFTQLQLTSAADRHRQGSGPAPSPGHPSSFALPGSGCKTPTRFQGPRLADGGCP